MDPEPQPETATPTVRGRPSARENALFKLKLFVQHYLKHQRLDLAAKYAGYTGRGSALSTTGGRLLKRAERLGLIEKARERTYAKIEKTRIASLQEALETASGIMRGRIGYFIDEEGRINLERVRAARRGVVRKYEITELVKPDGEDETVLERKTRFELESSLQAAKTLIDFHTDAKATKALGNGPTVNIFANLPPELAAALYRALMKPGTNGGNGHHPELPAPPLEGESKP